MKKRRNLFTLILSSIIIVIGTVAIISSKDSLDVLNKEVTLAKKEIKNDAIELSKEEVSNKDNLEYLPLEKDSNADDASKVLPETMHKWNFNRDDDKKIAYLTFDDGPSENITEKILDTLKKNNIKATFFTLGSSIEKNKKAKDILKRMAKEGHAIANHGYSHNYDLLYPNGNIDEDSFVNDMKKNENLLKGILGKDFKTRVIRMPGGSGGRNGIVALNKKLKDLDMYQTDWNSLNGDAEGNGLSVDYLMNSLIKTVGEQDVAIVLMHDTDAKENTAQFLQKGIDHLKSKGFEFRTLK